MSGVKFVRIRGRIVPIMDKAKSGLKKAGEFIKREAGHVGKGSTHPGAPLTFQVGFFGTIAAGSLGGAIGRSMAAGDRTKLIRGMHTDKDKVDAKKATSSVMSNVTVVTSSADAKKAFKTKEEQQYFGRMATLGTKNNAFAMRYKNKDYVFTTAKVSRSVLGHELGHIQDYRKNGTPGVFSRAFGSVTGATLRREKRAWELSPFKKQERKDLKEAALGTYEKYTRGVQVGAATAGAATWAVLRKLGRL